MVNRKYLEGSTERKKDGKYKKEHKKELSDEI